MDKPVLIDQAAKLLEVKPCRLRQIMRAKRVIDNRNLAHHDLVKKGLFHVETRQYVRGQTGIRNNYCVTLVTGAGLTYLSALLEEAKATDPQEGAAQ